MRRSWLPLAAILVLCGLVPPGGTAWATQVRPVNLEEMTEFAATIFAGRCLAVEVRTDPRLGREVTLATFEVHRAVKGERSDRVTLKMAGTTGHGEGVAGLPGFREGEEVVLFLYGESSVGLSSPVGLGQGKFSIVEDKLGRKIAINGFGNRHLMRGLSARARGRLGSAYTQWKDRREVDATSLLDMAQSLEP